MWADRSVFYHIYPLGFCGAEAENDFISAPIDRLSKIAAWIPHLCDLQINAVYLGPVWEACSHGYDTADYCRVDRRLGTNEEFAALVAQFHAAGIKVILDGVFNHVGRRFFAFQDVLQHHGESQYASWFYLNFNKENHYGDGFCYQGWDGCDNLVKLKLSNPRVREYIYKIVREWINFYHIDGLRLDVAHYLNKGFLRGLRQCCREQKDDFWLMGEVLYGDYRRFANEEMLDSVTNYECYHGLHSGINNHNMFEPAYSLARQFSEPDGIYRGLNLFNFADNHDVSRIASVLKDARCLKPLYTLMFTIPGIPCLYYGSEWGITGLRGEGDAALRPALELREDADLTKHIRYLIDYRRRSEVLAYGNYAELAVDSTFLAFSRSWQGKKLVIATNVGETPRSLVCDGHYWELPPFSSEIFRID